MNEGLIERLKKLSAVLSECKGDDGKVDPQQQEELISMWRNSPEGRPLRALAQKARSAMGPGGGMRQPQ